jgi:hypothetical protein
MAGKRRVNRASIMLALGGAGGEGPPASRAIAVPRRIKITVKPSSDHPDFLTVHDAMLQIADAFELLRGDGAVGYDWKLVTASTNSPFTAVGEIVPLAGAGPAIFASADLATYEAYQGLSDALDGDEAPQLDSVVLKRFLARNLNGVGLTAIEAEGDGFTALNVTPTSARLGLEALKAEVPAISPKRSRGTLEGYLVDAGQFRRQPALKLKERVRGRIIWCRIPEDLQNQFAAETSLRDVWQNARVRIRGWIEYSTGGKVSGMMAEKIVHVRPGPVDDRELFDRSFTGGVDAVSYTDRVRGGDIA